jgi:nitrite reductase/ring-hydroxylating ferredoxin subunit
MFETRRDFVALGCRIVSISALGPLIGCSNGPTSPSGAAGNLPTIDTQATAGVATLTVDANSPLSAVGSAALVKTSTTLLLVAHVSQDTFSAVTAVCTHEGCTITGFQNQIYVCPCHDSEYTTSGSVVRGPATQPLRQFATEFSGTTLTVALN